MPAKREKEIPKPEAKGFSGDEFLWNPFFDDEVQSILKSRWQLNYREPKQPKPGTNSFLLAWPILAYWDLTLLAFDVPKYWQDSWFGTYYFWDPIFITNLLSTVTKYVKLPPTEWDVERAFVECPKEEFLWENHKRFQRGAKKGDVVGVSGLGFPIVAKEDDIPQDGLPMFRQLQYPEIYKMICERCPSVKPLPEKQKLKGASEKEENINIKNLRTGVAYRIREKRLKILTDWQPNIDAYNLFQMPEDLSLLPCSPSVRFYEPFQPKAKRHKKRPIK